MASGPVYTCGMECGISWKNCSVRIRAAVVAATISAATSLEIPDESASYRSPGGTPSLSLSTESSPDHGNILLAFSGSGDLGLHHPLSCEVPATGSWICNL